MEQAFVTNFIFPLLAAGVTGLAWAAVKHPELFKIIARPISFLCIGWTMGALIFDYGVITALARMKAGLSADLTPKLEAAIDKVVIPAWVIAVPFLIATIILALIFIWHRLHYRSPFSEQKPEQGDTKP